MPIQLKNFSTKPPHDFDRGDIKRETKKLQKELRDLQYIMRAQEKYSLLIVLQGMDASGKDGAVKNLFKYVSPSDVKVKSWKAPSKEELAHDFLWRIHKYTPEKGMIQVFNRSHYEDILITRVHGWCDDKTAVKRIEAINNFEKLLYDNNTHILKFYLHLSYEEQEKRLNERKTVARKMWKHNDGDWEERKLWDTYMKYYEEAINATADNPWYIIPTDDNRYKEFLILTTIIEKLKSFKLEFPILDS